MYCCENRHIAKDFKQNNKYSYLAFYHSPNTTCKTLWKLQFYLLSYFLVHPHLKGHYHEIFREATQLELYHQAEKFSNPLSISRKIFEIWRKSKKFRGCVNSAELDSAVRVFENISSCFTKKESKYVKNCQKV